MSLFFLISGYLMVASYDRGGPGQTLSIRHDTINRECYMPGVILAVREITKRQGFIYGLDQLLGL